MKEGRRLGCVDKASGRQAGLNHPSSLAPVPLCVLFVILQINLTALSTSRHSQSYSICQSKGVAADRFHTRV